MKTATSGRRRLRRWLLGFLALIVFVLGWGFLFEPGRLTIRRQTLCLENWPKPMNGFRVAVLTDLHVGSPHNGLDNLRRIVDQTNRVKPHLVVLLGDYVIHGVLGGKFVEPEPIARELQLIQASLGTLAVLGNHDGWYDGPRIKLAFQSAGIGVLENEAAPMQWKGMPLWVVGLTDLWVKKPAPPDPVGPLQAIPDKQPILMLTHNPDIFPQVPARVSLTLAGHTHGGQVYLPILGRLRIPSSYGQRYAIGHVMEDGKHLFVSPGLGTSIAPIRFLVPPEISLLELNACQPDPA